MFEMFTVPFVWRALVISSLTGAFFAFAGVYVVLRRMVFASIALSQAAACGFAFGLLTGFNLTLSSLAFTLAAVVIFSFHTEEKRLTSESFTAFIYALFSALSIIFLAKSRAGEGGLLDIFSGNILTISNGEIYLAAGLFFVSFLAHIVFYRKFIFVFFDPETAKTQGINTAFWNFLFYLILGVMLSASIKTTGVLLSFSSLAIPAMTAMILCERIKMIFAVSVLIALISAFAGVYLSWLWDLPGGITNTAVMCLLFIITTILSRRG
ncbi:MAG: hypothetical protein A2219_02880 [Elusimicrobia bacterium RIFOXYA2_FULL_50_26]|nr:MAG: hypothetical protein A2219_02880 [Elusimicrobia bacterium RIFOXYA2_FULL_50_26]